MPCHPDRVRRNYDVDAGPAERRLTTGQRVLCVHCQRPDHPSHLAWWGHAFRAPGPMTITDNGFTANVIEGDKHE